jgi:hypothetical protein
MTKDEALAFDLALGALKEDRAWLESDAPIEIWEKNNEAITAIKQARALDKMAENARELGLDYEPVAPVQEDWGPGPHECHSLTASVQEPPPECQTEAEKRAYAFGWWKALEANRATPAQEPVAWTVSGKITDWSKDFSAYQTKHYTRPVYTPPAQRQWVDLTAEEIDSIYEQHHNQYAECISVNFGYERAIEAKLKEKNT